MRAVTPTDQEIWILEGGMSAFASQFKDDRTLMENVNLEYLENPW